MRNQHSTDPARAARQSAVTDLYHFTRVLSLADIVATGFRCGEVPVTPFHVVEFPWFSREFSHQAQMQWASRDPHKMFLRLEVEFDPSDKLLVCWKDYAAFLNIRPDWYKILT